MLKMQIETGGRKGRPYMPVLCLRIKSPRFSEEWAFISNWGVQRESFPLAEVKGAAPPCVFLRTMLPLDREGIY